MVLPTATGLNLPIDDALPIIPIAKEGGPTLAIYPGTFDPITYGHLDIIGRALSLFDRLIVTVAINVQKTPLFSLEERMELIRNCFPDPSTPVQVDYTDGLIVDYAVRHRAQSIIRGLRAISDFDYEFQLALMNRRLERNVETVFLMTGFRWIYISSSGVKNAARCGGNVEGLVPEHVALALRRKFDRYDGCMGAER